MVRDIVTDPHESKTAVSVSRRFFPGAVGMGTAAPFQVLANR